MTCANRMSSRVAASERLRLAEKAMPTLEKRRSTVAEVAGHAAEVLPSHHLEVGELLLALEPPDHRVLFGLQKWGPQGPAHANIYSYWTWRRPTADAAPASCHTPVSPPAALGAGQAAPAATGSEPWAGGTDATASRAPC